MFWGGGGMVFCGHLHRNHWLFCAWNSVRKAHGSSTIQKTTAYFSIPNPSICIWLLLWLHYVFPFPMLMSVHPGTWGGSIESVTIFIEWYKRQADSLRAREQLFVLLIARNKSCGSSNKRWLLCDIFPYSWEEKKGFFCVFCCLGRRGGGGFVQFICFFVKFYFIPSAPAT